MSVWSEGSVTWIVAGAGRFGVLVEGGIGLERGWRHIVYLVVTVRAGVIGV
jgi:hypothetical protein